MKILITGGSGMLGQAIIHDPLFADDEFVILSRRYGHYKLSERVTYQNWNPYVLNGWQKVLDKTDVVINLAGENIGNGYWNSYKKDRILMSRVSAGRSLEKSILEMDNPPGVFFQASAVGFYGSRGNEMLDENASNGEGFLANVCKKWEASTDQLETIGVRRMILRTGVVLSRESGIYPRLRLPIKLFIGGDLGNGKQYVPWLHVDDFPSIIHFLIHHEDASGIYNLCSQPVTFSEFGKKLAKRYHRPYWLTVPDFALRLLLGEMSDLVLDSQRVVPARLTSLGYKYRFAELNDAFQSFV